jgi:serine kinase of HPr protein (carbohydrate metabolism regulator)
VSDRHNVHATGLVLGGKGLLLRGPSGSGKSTLALSLIDTFEARGLGGKLVSDDRVDIEPTKGALIMHAPASIAGLVELRGRGIVSRPHATKARLHLVVDFVGKLERMVEEEDLVTELFGVVLPRAPVPKAGVVELAHQQLLVLEALRSLSTSKAAARQKST